MKMMRNPKINRISVKGLLLIFGMVIFLTEGVCLSAEQVTVRITTAMFCQQRTPEMYSAEHRLLEKYAKKFGYDVKVERPEFLSGRDMVEAIIAGRGDIGGCGQSPALSVLATDTPIYLAGAVYTVGHEGHWLVVRPNGQIGSLDDLVKAKSLVGVPVGTTAHMFLDFMFYAAYGKSATDMGITLIDMSAAEAAAFPKGVDAIAIWGATPFRLVEKKLGEILVSERGDPGPAWTGPVENGKVPFFKNALFYPEGFQLSRGFGLVRKEFGDKYPKIVVAQMLANLEAMKALDQSTSSGRELAWKYSQDWDLPKDIVLKLHKVGLGFGGNRLWNWIVEGDVKALTWSAPWMHNVGAAKKLVTWDDAKEKFKWAAKVEKEAWEMAGKYPDMKEFTRTDVPPLRGYPSWMMDKWKCEPPPKF